MKKFLKVILIIAVVLGVLFWGGIMIISSLGGNSEEWKKQVELIASSLINRDVRIGTMNDTRFYPDMLTDLQDVSVMSLQDKNEPSVSIKSIKFSFPFWSVFRGQMIVQGLDVRGVQPVHDGNWSIRHLGIVPPKTEDAAPLFIIDGLYNTQPLSLEIEMGKVEKGYMMTPDMPFTASLAGLPITGALKIEEGRTRLDGLKIGEGDTALNGDIAFGSKELDLSLAFGRSQVKGDFRLEPDDKRMQVRGTLAFPALDVADLDGGPFKEVTAALEKLQDGRTKAPEDNSVHPLQLSDFDIKVAVGAFMDGETKLGGHEADLFIRTKQDKPAQLGLMGTSGTLRLELLDAVHKDLRGMLFKESAPSGPLVVQCLLGEANITAQRTEIVAFILDAGETRLSGNGYIDHEKDVMEFNLLSAQGGGVRLKGSVNAPTLAALSDAEIEKVQIVSTLGSSDFKGANAQNCTAYLTDSAVRE